MIHRTFGDVILSLWPDLAKLIAVLFAALIVIRLAAWALRAAERRHLQRQRQQRRERDLPVLSRAIGRVERTQAMDLGGLVHPPHGAHIAAGAPTEVIGHRGQSDAGLGDIDPDPGLGGDR